MLSRPDLLTNPEGFTREECMALYHDVRRYFDEFCHSIQNEGDQWNKLKEYMRFGTTGNRNNRITERRIIIRTSILIGCVLVRESEMDGDAFPSRYKRSYPPNYGYTVLDMYISKTV